MPDTDFLVSTTDLHCFVDGGAPYVSTWADFAAVNIEALGPDRIAEIFATVAAGGVAHENGFQIARAAA